MNGCIHTQFELITAPTDLPVSLENVKAHLRILGNEEDQAILGALYAARDECEKRVRRSFINTTYDLHLDDFPSLIELRLPTVSSVTHIKYYDTTNTQQTYSSSNYETDLKSAPARIKPIYGVSWPSVYSRLNAVTVRFVSGYGSSPASVPLSVQQAIKLYCGALFENRQPTDTEMQAVDCLLDNARWGSYE